MGRFELLCSCDDEQWVRSIVSNIGRMSLDATLGIGHTIDIGPIVGPDAPIQGVYLEGECCVPMDGENFCVFRVIGITRSELEYKLAEGEDALLEALKSGGVYPHTRVGRTSVELPQTTNAPD